MAIVWYRRQYAPATSVLAGPSIGSAATVVVWAVAVAVATALTDATATTNANNAARTQSPYAAAERRWPRHVTVIEKRAEYESPGATMGMSSRTSASVAAVIDSTETKSARGGTYSCANG